MQQYYVYGTVDDCTGHWGKLMDCLKKKTTRYKDDVPEDPTAGKHPLWELRTPSEASEFWTAEFDRNETAAEGAGQPTVPGGATAGQGMI